MVIPPPRFLEEEGEAADEEEDDTGQVPTPFAEEEFRELRPPGVTTPGATDEGFETKPEVPPAGEEEERQTEPSTPPAVDRSAATGQVEPQPEPERRGGVFPSLEEIIGGTREALAQVLDGFTIEFPDWIPDVGDVQATVDDVVSSRLNALGDDLRVEFDVLTSFLDARLPEEFPDVEPLEDAIDDARSDIEDLDIPTAEELAEEFPNVQSIVDDLETSLDDTLSSIESSVNTVNDGLSDVQDAFPDDFDDAVQDGVTTASPRVGGVRWIESPVEFTGTVLTRGLDRVTTDRTREQLRDFNDRFEP